MFSFTSIFFFLFAVLQLVGALRAQHKPHLPAWGLLASGTGAAICGFGLAGWAVATYPRLTPSVVLIGLAGATLVAASFFLLRVGRERRRAGMTRMV